MIGIDLNIDEMPPSARISFVAVLIESGRAPKYAYYLVLITSCGVSIIQAHTPAKPPEFIIQSIFFVDFCASFYAQ